MHHLIKTGDIDLSVQVEGSGPLVILMHGWPELGLSWRHQVPALAAAGWRVAVPDMRGYGGSGKPAAIEDYRLDRIADDMQAVASALGARRWVAVGHDWGAPAAWRCALRFPDSVAAVFALSVPHSGPPPRPFLDIIDAVYPDRFFYIRYFQTPGVAEAEFEGGDLAASLKRVFYMGSFDGVAARSGRHVPRDSTMLASMDDPPPDPLSFMSDAELPRMRRPSRPAVFAARSIGIAISRKMPPTPAPMATMWFASRLGSWLASESWCWRCCRASWRTCASSARICAWRSACRAQATGCSRSGRRR
jgi:pimeloyl-ACP methyl ester carboxylesterase